MDSVCLFLGNTTIRIMLSWFQQYTVKKGSQVSRLQPGCHYTKLSLDGKNDVIT
jgi:hypothetical protein